MKLLHQLVLNTDTKLDSLLLQQLYNFCKNPDNVKLVWNDLLKLIQKKHGKVRYFGFLLLNELFEKSHLIRNLACRQLDLDLFLDATLEPMEWRQKLYTTFVSSITEWKNRYSKWHPQLNVIHDQVMSKYRLLESCSDKKDDKKTKGNELRLQKYVMVFDVEFDRVQKLVMEHVVQLQSIINLVIPSLTDLQNDCMNNDIGSNDILNQGSITNHGLGNQSYTLDIQITKKFIQDQENKILFDSLREHRRVILLYKTRIQEWLNLCYKVEDVDKKRHEQNLKLLIDLNICIHNAIEKSGEILDFLYIENDSDEEEDFVQVDELNLDQDRKNNDDPVVNDDGLNSGRGGKDCIVSKVTTGLLPVFNNTMGFIENTIQDTTLQDTVYHDDTNPELKELFQIAPIVPYDTDLDYWTTESITFQQISQKGGIDFHHRFLGDGPEKNISKETLEKLRTRNIQVPEKKQEYQRCNAKLQNGGLCPRRDMERCPFHGLIVQRDVQGNPIDVSDYKSSSIKKPLWEQIEHDVVQEKKKSKLVLLPKKSIKGRILKRMGKKVQPVDYKQRDRNAFRWSN